MHTSCQSREDVFFKMPPVLSFSNEYKGCKGNLLLLVSLRMTKSFSICMIHTFFFRAFQFRKLKFTFPFEPVLFRKQKDFKITCLFGTGPGGILMDPHLRVVKCLYTCSCVLHVFLLVGLQTRG